MILRSIKSLRHFSTAASSTVPSIQIRIHHDPNSIHPLSNLNLNIEPRWSEDYELISTNGGITTDITGDVNQETRKLKLNIHVPSTATDSSLLLAVPQRCHVTMMGSKTLNLKHNVHVGNGCGRLEGDLKVFVPQGDIHVQKSRGENVELRTVNGGVHIKSVLEGLNADISSTNGFSAKRVMGENVTVRVSGGGNHDEVEDSKGSTEEEDNKINISAIYGGQFYLQSPKGSVNIDTAQVRGLDVRSGGSEGIRVGGMSGTIIAHAIHNQDETNDSNNASNNASTPGDVHVNFDQMFPVITGGKKNQDSKGADNENSFFDFPERSTLKSDGHVHVALSDATPFAVHIDLKTYEGDITLPLDYDSNNAPIDLGRQASTSDIKTALFVQDEEEEDDAHRVRGVLRSTPKKKSRASNSGGSGKISSNAGSDLLNMKEDGKDYQGSLIVMAEKDVSVSIHGWMDRIKAKHMG